MFPTLLSLLVSFLALCYSSKLLLFYLVFLTFLIRYFLLTQSSCVVLILNFLIYIFLQILFTIRRYTNFQKCLNFYNVGIASFYRICMLAATITMRLLFLDVLCGDESLISVFRFLCKAIVPIYWSAYLPFLLSKKILFCSLRFIKFLILNTLRLIILFLRFLFHLVVLYLLSVLLTSNMSRIGSVFDDNVSFIVNDDFNDFRPFLNDDFNDFRSFLIFSNDSVVIVDARFKVDNYLNRKF